MIVISPSLELIAYIPLERKLPGVGGWRWAVHPTPEFCVGDTNMLVSTRRQTPDAKPKICVSPNAKPRRQSVEYRWRWVFWHWPCIFHVYFMYISCCLCTFFHVGNAKNSRHKGRFQWNTGFTLQLYPLYILFCTKYILLIYPLEQVAPTPSIPRLFLSVQ